MATAPSEMMMARVAECTVPECVYNRGSRCYARAITIGNGSHPQCDTFHLVNNHVPRRPNTAGVGACKVSSCAHNYDYACNAERIYVGYEGNDIACLAYRGP